MKWPMCCALLDASNPMPYLRPLALRPQSGGWLARQKFPTGNSEYRANHGAMQHPAFLIFSSNSNNVQMFTTNDHLFKARNYQSR
jgi:hypothetical protein